MHICYFEIYFVNLKISAKERLLVNGGKMHEKKNHKFFDELADDIQSGVLCAGDKGQCG